MKYHDEGNTAQKASCEILLEWKKAFKAFYLNFFEYGDISWFYQNPVIYLTGDISLDCDRCNVEVGIFGHFFCIRDRVKVLSTMIKYSALPQIDPEELSKKLGLFVVI